MELTTQIPGLEQLLANPGGALGSPVITMLLRLWGARLVALIILKWGTEAWIPRVVEHYRVTHFAAEYPTPYERGFLTRWLWILVQALIIYVAGYGHVPEVLPFLALVAVALQGVIVSDLRYHVIPDRFQLLGGLGAAGFAALAWLPATATFSTLSIGEFPVKFLLFNALKGVGVAVALYIAGLLYSRLRHREAMGFGDIKLIAWLGIALGSDTLNVLFYSLVAAAVLMFPLWLIRRRRFEHAFAFGPYIVLGCLIHGLFLTGQQAEELISFVKALGGLGA